VQATPHLLAFLRWFHEEMPEMPVIAAGSLLDFALRDHEFSMPVGRIAYCYLEPVSFYEFLAASGNELLKSALTSAAESLALNPRLHQRALELFSEYCLVGGLPEVVADWLVTHDDGRRLQLQRNLLTTYQDDFNKYRQRISMDLLRQVMDAVPCQLGGRFVYSHVDAASNHRDIKQALELLRLARICHRVDHTSANGLPLGAEPKAGLFKMVMLDVGLVSVLLGLSRLDMRDLVSVVWANKGGLAEQFVGQHLRCLFREYEEPRLYYWQRTEGRLGEIDYLLQDGSRIIPVEVKAGKAGAMKSLHTFMQGNNLDYALRLDINPPSVQDLDILTTTGEPVQYRLLSLPLYMVESIPVAIRRR
jgi:predicted AAA+ superfamily ATPase